MSAAANQRVRFNHHHSSLSTSQASRNFLPLVAGTDAQIMAISASEAPASVMHGEPGATGPPLGSARIKAYPHPVHAYYASSTPGSSRTASPLLHPAPTHLLLPSSNGLSSRTSMQSSDNDQTCWASSSTLLPSALDWSAGAKADASADERPLCPSVGIELRRPADDRTVPYTVLSKARTRVILALATITAFLAPMSSNIYISALPSISKVSPMWYTKRTKND